MKKEWLQEMKRFCEEESGVGVVEIILVLVVIVGLILIFKKQLTSHSATLMIKRERYK